MSCHIYICIYLAIWKCLVHAGNLSSRRAHPMAHGVNEYNCFRWEFCLLERARPTSMCVCVCMCLCGLIAYTPTEQYVAPTHAQRILYGESEEGDRFEHKLLPVYYAFPSHMRLYTRAQSKTYCWVIAIVLVLVAWRNSCSTVRKTRVMNTCVVVVFVCSRGVVRIVFNFNYYMVFHSLLAKKSPFFRSLWRCDLRHILQNAHFIRYQCADAHR